MRELAAMRKSIEELRQSLEELPQRIARANPASSNGSGPSPNSNAAIQEILILLRELWDLALLDDERQLQRVEVLRQQRRSGFIAEADKLIARGDWSVAERAIAAFESDFGTSDEIAELKNRLTASRIRVEQTTLRDLNSRVDDLVAISSWDQALALTTRFVENFPNSAEGRELLDRLRHHRDSHVEITANRLYDEIKSYINNRRWRDALANAKRLMESFPGHRRAAMIRPQLATIRENAEIEQRHEQEARIQESIRKRDFVEAIELAEDLVQKFPHSPQAASLHELLPRLQELLQEDIEKQTAEAETDGAAAS
jgi:outer membrane protein assembly factor BamD (BamD/ComL family)